MKVIHNRNNYVPYIDRDLKATMKQRDALKVLASKSGLVQDFANYKEKRNLVTQKLKYAKKEHYKSKFANADLTTADVWLGAKQLLGNVKCNFPTQILAKGKLLSKPFDMATAVNEYFLEKIQNLKDLNVSGSHVEATCVLENFLQKKQLPPEGFVLCELTEDKVRTLIRKIKGKKSCGIDWICGLSLKCVA